MKGEHAVVVGASMAGLVAARVLSTRFEHVTIVDRDRLPEADENRAGVPQGRHGHGLLASGFRSLERLFPGLEQELVAAGAIPGDVIGNVRWFQHGYYKAKFPSGLGGILLSRALLEGTLRRRVRRQSNVSIMEGTYVSGLATDASRERVTGVRLDRSGRETTLSADLVIDASGRSSRSPEWLTDLGYEAPDVDRVEIDLCYTTRTFRRRPRDLQGDMGAILAPTPPGQTRVGFMLAMEGDRWIVTIGGWRGDQAPTDPQGFLAFSRTLSRPDIYEVIKDAEPLTEAVPFKFRSNMRCRYENLARFPDQYLVMGDAICSFNPFYGQGMSVAALEGLALEQCLTGRPRDCQLWSLFFGIVARVVDTPWMIASGSDFAFDGVTGPKPQGTDLINWYLARVHRAAASDAMVCRAFFDVANLLEPATSLFQPAVVMRVASGSMRPSEPPSQVARRWLETERRTAVL